MVKKHYLNRINYTGNSLRCDGERNAGVSFWPTELVDEGITARWVRNKGE